MRRRLGIITCSLLAFAPVVSGAPRDPSTQRTIRVATFNVEDINPTSIVGDRHRLRHLGRVIRDIAPDIILLNEVAYGPTPDADEPEVPLLAEVLLKGFIRRAGTVEALEYTVFAAPSNTGIHSGFDLDNSGGLSPEPGSRAYGGDCLGYGAFPGQYAMALLVRHDLPILRDEVRTFREFLWKDMPDALLPPIVEEEGGAVVPEAWYSDEELSVLPLSSKSHWDVPVRLPDGRVLHVLCSHPTPPVFDGAEDRNGRRNHDEIRFWAEYVNGAQWIYDDQGNRGGLEPGALFVILGDLNADPDEGDSFGNPIKRFLLDHPRVQDPTPTSAVEIERLENDDTSRFRLRVDYVFPSRGLDVVAAGVVRGPEDLPGRRGESDEVRTAWGEMDEFPSDHFPVWVDLALEESAGKGTEDTEE